MEHFMGALYKLKETKYGVWSLPIVFYGSAQTMKNVTLKN